LASFYEVLAKEDIKIFNPTGWMPDKAGANWAAISNVYGKESFNRTVGCQFHFKQSVNRHANQLGSSRSTVQLKKLSNDLMQATTPTLYNKCMEALKDFIYKKPSRQNFFIFTLHCCQYHQPPQRRMVYMNGECFKPSTPITLQENNIHHAISHHHLYPWKVQGWLGFYSS
jgi:hypothetical protein